MYFHKLKNEPNIRKCHFYCIQIQLLRERVIFATILGGVFQGSGGKFLVYSIVLSKYVLMHNVSAVALVCAEDDLAGQRYILAGDKQAEAHGAVWYSNPIRCQKSTGTLTFK